MKIESLQSILDEPVQAGTSLDSHLEKPGLFKRTIERIRHGLKGVTYPTAIALVCAVIALTLSCRSKQLSNPEWGAHLGFGTISSYEETHRKASANKSMIRGGLDITFGEEFRKQLGVVYSAMAEPVDQDSEVANDFLKLFGKLSYHPNPDAKTSIYPIGGLGAQRWRRNSPDVGPQDGYWGDLYFVDVTLGLGIKHKNIHFEAQGSLPYWVDTDSGHKPKGKLGYKLIMWYPLKNDEVYIGIFHNQRDWKKDGSQPPLDLGRTGALLKWKF